MMKSKKQTEPKVESLKDAQGASLNFNDFKEALVKIACFGKFKLGGGPSMTEEEEKI